jgi:acetolactate synthase-1/2/3 large subunit
MTMVHGGRLVAQALKRHGTTHLFTLCGGHIQAIYDGCLDEEIRVVDVRHEQTAGHAADGYARVTGRPGVCAVTAGPGVTDVVTAAANAQRAGVPMIIIGGAGPSQLTDMGSLQDMNHLELMRSITKWSVRVPETRRIAEYVDAAFRIAQADLPGPVFLEMPLDMLMNFADDADLPNTAPTPPARSGGDPHAISRAIALLEKAERPMAIVGTQLRWSNDRTVVKKAADAWGIPFFLNGMARGALPADHPAFFSRSRRQALSRADLVLVFGTPFDFRLDYGRAISSDAKVVQVDLEGKELGRNRKVDVPIDGDTGLVIEQLLQGYSKSKDASWLAEIRAAETKSRAKMAAEIESNDSPVNPLRLCAEIDRRLRPNDVVVGDGGDFVATAAYVLKMQAPQIWMDPGPLGTLGVGPGYAMAAACARPNHGENGATTWLIYGDGSFGLHGLEFEALARQKLPVLAVIGNDAGWTQIRRGQVELYGEQRAPATALDYTHYEKVVEACGGVGLWVERAEDVGPALDKALEATRAGKPACVNVKIAKSEFRKGAISV